MWPDGILILVVFFIAETPIIPAPSQLANYSCEQYMRVKGLLDSGLTKPINLMQQREDGKYMMQRAAMVELLEAQVNYS